MSSSSICKHSEENMSRRNKGGIHRYPSCGKVYNTFTSQSSKNPKRRYYSCKQDDNSRYFAWCDEVDCQAIDIKYQIKVLDAKYEAKLTDLKRKMIGFIFLDFTVMYVFEMWFMHTMMG